MIRRLLRLVALAILPGVVRCKGCGVRAFDAHEARAQGWRPIDGAWRCALCVRTWEWVEVYLAERRAGRERAA